MEFNRFEFRVFLLLDWLPKHGWSKQSILLFNQCWIENYWIHPFPKSITPVWNSNSLIQDLNSCICAYIKGLNVHGTHVTANNSASNYAISFFCFRSKNSILKQLSIFDHNALDKRGKIFASLLFWKQKH